MSDQQAAIAMIRAVHDDGVAEINGRSYKFLKMTHKQRRKVFSFYTRVANQVQRNDFSFLDMPEFEPVEAVVNKTVTYNDSLLSVIGDAHWEKYPDDYLMFVGTALAVISFPFLSANATSLTSE